jgi:spore coat protein H
MAHWWREDRRSLTDTVLLLAILAATMVILLAFAPTPIPPEPVPSPPTLLAFAYAMPHQGWAPLTVHLSPFGSRDLSGTIVRYEWDLDGDGVFETDATSSQGYAQAFYTRPRTYAPALRVTNALGQSASASALVTIRHPASSDVDYWTLFDDTRVRRITLSFAQEDWDRMMADPTAKVRVEGAVEVFGERLERVSIGPRGNFTLNIAGEKIPWQIDTDNLVPGQEFHNLRQLLLTNNIADAALMGEKLVYDLLAFAGVPSSHVCFVEVWVDIEDDGADARYWGVYTLVERVDRRFIGNRFGQAGTGGTLYKTNHYRRGAGDLVYYGPTIDYYPQPHGVPLYDLRTDDAPADYADLIQFLWVLDGQTYASPEAWADAVESVFNMDGFLRWLAVETAIMSWDVYPFTGNNYYLYHDPTRDRWEWLPWDQTWGDNTRQPLFALPEDMPRLLERAPLYDNLFAVPRYRQTFAAYLDLLVREAFNEAAMSARARAYRDLIAPYLALGDPAYVGEGAMHTLEAFEDSWQRLVELTRDRSAFIRFTLDSGPEAYLWTP